MSDEFDPIMDTDLPEEEELEEGYGMGEEEEEDGSADFSSDEEEFN